MVHRNGRVTVRQCYYSVPARFIGMKVRVKLKANEVWIFDERKVVARHPRLTRRYTYHDILDHYLEILLVKPGAFAGAAAPSQARAEGVFTKTHEAFWAAAKKRCGNREGTPDNRGAVAAPSVARGGGDCEYSHRVEGWRDQHRPGGDRARKAIENTEEAEGSAADIVAVTGSDAVEEDSGRGEQADAGAKVISLHTKRMPPDLRPGLPDMSKYDRLLKPVTTTSGPCTRGATVI